MQGYWPLRGGRWRAVLPVVLAMSLIVGGVAAAAVLSPPVELRRAVGGAGATSATVGDVTLRGTLGQPFVGVHAGDDVTVKYGFWHGVEVGEVVYLPLVLSGD